MSTDSPTKPSLGRGVALALLVASLAVVAGLFAGTAGAQTAASDTEAGGGGGRHPVRAWVRSLTDEQRQCLKDHGVERPQHRPTQEQIDAFRQALDDCGIPVPDAVARVQEIRQWAQGLTDEQRQCLKDHGVHRPRRHHRPTQAQLQTLRDAAAACSIDLPDALQPS